MRAIVLGLVGVALAAGAQAGQCKLDGLSLTAEAREPAVFGKGGFSYNVDRPDLVGRTFTVDRASSDFWRVGRGAPGDLRDDGSISVVVQSGGETFVIKQVYNGNAGTQEMGYSYTPDDAATKGIKWPLRSLKAEASRFGGFFDVYGGPLNGLVLKAPNCI
jgi:hypothetical protein